MNMNRVVFKDEEKRDFRVDEAVKTLRANVQFSGEDIKTIAVTSSVPGEGKSTVAMKLAQNFAEAGKFTVLLDCDIRMTKMMDSFHVEGEVKGLSEYLCGMAKYEDILQKTNKSSFYMVFAGHHVPNPSELLSGYRFSELIKRLREDFEVVIIDTPPVSSVIDGAIVASRCDGAVLVVASEQISRKMLQRVKWQLKKSGVHILGVVLNKVNTQKNSYYYYRYGYDKYGDYTDSYLEPQEENKK